MFNEILNYLLIVFSSGLSPTSWFPHKHTSDIDGCSFEYIRLKSFIWSSCISVLPKIYYYRQETNNNNIELQLTIRHFIH